MQEKHLIVKGLSNSQGKMGAYALILAETEGKKRKLPIIIGGAEAQSIALAMEKSVRTIRPLPHDTWFNTLQSLGATLEKILIHKLVNGVFYASLHITSKEGAALVFDSRPSDAVALAVRFDAPIFATEEILDKAGFNAEEEAKSEQEQEAPKATESLELDERDLEALLTKAPENSTTPPVAKEQTIKDLEELLARAVEDEDYERAARLRDQISRLK